MIVRLRNEARPNKYGIVRLFDARERIVHEHKITGDELRKVQHSRNGVPPGCQRRDWEAGPRRAVLLGCNFDVGDLAVESGRLWIKVGEPLALDSHGRLKNTWAVFEPGEWSGLPPKVSVPRSVIEKMDQSRSSVRLRSLIDGVAEVG